MDSHGRSSSKTAAAARDDDDDKSPREGAESADTDDRFCGDGKWGAVVV